MPFETLNVLIFVASSYPATLPLVNSTPAAFNALFVFKYNKHLQLAIPSA